MAILGLGKHHYLKRLGISLLVAALVVGTIGCLPPDDVVEYTLTISSTAGGSVTLPGEGAFTSLPGTKFWLRAKAEHWHRFDGWTGDTQDIADPDSAYTTIIMNDDYSITAQFEALDPEDLFAGGSGTPGDPYQLADWHHLHNVRYVPHVHYALTSSLDSATAGYAELAGPTANDGKGWEPIGLFVPGAVPFTGNLDGQGYEIRDLFIDRLGAFYVSLFGEAGEGAVVQNVGLVNANITGGRLVGTLVGRNAGHVSNSYATGNVTGEAFVGGLVGGNDYTVTNSYFYGTVTGDSSVGGLVGSNRGLVSNSSAFAEVTASNAVGALAGGNVGTVSNSYSAGNVTGDSGVGGLVGVNWFAVVTNSYYNHDEVLINGENIITIGALFGEDFDEWLANDMFLDVDDRLSEENGYHLVYDVDDFKQLLAFGQDDSLKFRLEGDLDLAGEPNLFIPYLAGEFDGNGHGFSNLSFNFDFVSHVGLFGYLASGAVVSEVGVKNVNMTGGSCVGGLVGYSRGAVTNSYSSGSVSGQRYIGGLLGLNEGFLSSSYSTGSVTGQEYVGGLVGRDDGVVRSCYSTGSVSGSSYVGGLVGRSYRSTVDQSYSTGTVTGDEHVGGLVGSSSGDVSNSYSTGTVTGDSYVGGLMGRNEGDVSNSYSTGTVTGDNYVGGLVGWNDGGTVTGSFWDVEASGVEESDGGTGRTTEELMNIAAYTDTATPGLDDPWDMVLMEDFDPWAPSTWYIDSGVDYPRLYFQYPDYHPAA